MDSSIRPIQNQPTRPTAPVTRRREGEPFRVPDDAAEPDEEEDDAPAKHESSEDRPVAPRPEDEAGSHLDITA